MGPYGLRQVAEVSFKRAHNLAERLAALPGWELAFPERLFLNEFPIRVPKAPAVLRKLARKGILGGLDAGRWFPDLKGVSPFTFPHVHASPPLAPLLPSLK